MPAKKRDDTAKPTKELKCKEIKIIVEADPPQAETTTWPAAPQTGKWHAIVNDGVPGFEPHE